MKKAFALLIFLFSFSIVWSQEQNAIVGGPMLGFVELRTANVWCEVSGPTQKVSISYKKDGISGASASVAYKGLLGQDFNPINFQLTGLDFNTTYQYEITAVAGQKTFRKSGRFRTTDLWQFRKNAPDFVFQSLMQTAAEELDVQRWQLVQETITDGAMVA